MLKIVFPLRYLSNFCRSLKMSLINCKIYLELNWTTEDCILSSDGDSANSLGARDRFIQPIFTTGLTV